MNRLNYTLKENLYDIDEPWTDDKAWLLGLLWSDGGIRNNTIQITMIDLQCIKEIIKILELTKEIIILSKWKFNNVNHKESYRIEFTNNIFTSNLRRIGFYENKTHTIEYPKELPDKFFGGFFRGLMDGDGWISITKYGFNTVCLGLASKSLVDGVCKKLEKFDIKYTIGVKSKHLKNGKINKKWNGTDFYTIRISAESKNKLYNLMYKDSSVKCLKRKYKKFTEAINRVIKQNKWSEEEINRLKKIHKLNKPNDWNELLLQFPGRTRNSINGKLYRKNKING